MNYNELQKELKPKQGQIQKNLTGRYLLQQVKLLDPELLSKLNQHSVLAFGLCDRNYEYYNEFDNKLFILIKMSGDIAYWQNNYEYYLYQDGEADKLMIIIDLPINNRNDFLEGNYSKLYTTDVVDEIFPKYTIKRGVQSITSAWAVINKTEEAREQFENKVNKDFKLDPKVTITKDQEYEYPPVLKREIFNA